MNQLWFRPVQHLKMTVRTLVLLSFINKSLSRAVNRGMNTRGKNWLLWKGRIVCRFICVLFHNFWTNYDSAPQNDCQNFSFVKDTYVDGKKLARNCRKTATYYVASFHPHYRRVLFLHLSVFNLWCSTVHVAFRIQFSCLFKLYCGG